MPRRELAKKPLAEAYLELHWDLVKKPGTDLSVDPNYRILLARFFERAQGHYPFHEPMPASNLPDEMVPYLVQHRFRTAAAGWPLVQIGPGILSVNETVGYRWDDFKDRCCRAVEMLVEAYPQKADLHPNSLALRYINAVPFDPTTDDVLDFLSKQMKTTFSLPTSLFKNERLEKIPNVFNSTVSFRHNDPSGILALSLGTGTHNGASAVVWQTEVHSFTKDVPRLHEGFPDWLNKAHETTDDCFFKLIEGDLERRFSGE